MTQPNYQQISDSVTKSLIEAANGKESGGVVLKFDTVAVNGLANDPNLLISYATDLSPTTAKLIFHVKGISPNNMEVIGKALWKLSETVLHPLPSNIRVEASESPVFRSQWDFIVWGIPVIRSGEIRALILKTMREALLQANK